MVIGPDDKLTDNDIDSVLGTGPEKAELAIPDIHSLAGMGMSRVDKADIRPPQIILVQALTDRTLVKDRQGIPADVGTFFHTGKNEILKDFECYFIFAAKGEYQDRRSGETMSKYSVIGILDRDMTTFGMVFRSSAFYSLNSLFTVATDQKLPMFSIKCHVEQKLLKNDKGEWYIPVVRPGDVVSDPKKFNTLYEYAKQFDSKANEINLEPEEEAHGEEVNPDEIPV